MVGLIPAWAGKTSYFADVRKAGQAHPRVGGENGTPSGRASLPWGSSPRGRGKHRGLCAVLKRDGLIPAWAGKTPSLAADARAGCGSSPRGRGKRARPRGRRHSLGLIPAWAGKTVNGAGKLATQEAHPRVGGENQEVAAERASTTGSSPRGRGKRRSCDDHDVIEGLIPAWAGKTSGSRKTRDLSTAHPRVGGENVSLDKAGHGVFGSSPRGRGKQGDWSGLQRRVGLIPAWAGKTTASKLSSRPATAHPRVGGENMSITQRAMRTVGSSPRGRGKPPGTNFFMRGFRLIPAWAGKTQGKGCD